MTDEEKKDTSSGKKYDGGKIPKASAAQVKEKEEEQASKE